MTRRDALKVVTTIAGAAVCANPVEAAFTKSCEGIGDVTWVRLSNGHKVWTKRVGNTLTIGAAHDFMNPVSIRREAAILPRGECFISQTGSHLAMWDDQKSYFAAVDRFLRKRAVAAQ